MNPSADLCNKARVQFQKAALGIFSGAEGGFLGTVGGLLGFSSGGYTGSGPISEPAGIVHRGEYVVNAGAVRQPGVRQKLESLNSGQKNSASASAPAQSQAPEVTVVQHFNIAANGDDSVRRIVRQEAPRVAQMAKAAVAEAKARGERGF